MTAQTPEPGRWFDVNVARAGEIFIKTLWIQSQMADLLTFAERPDLVGPYLASPANMPMEFVLLRADKWETLDFGPTKDAFIGRFDSWLEGDDKADLEFLASLRNAIAHSHVSIGRDYFLYRPRHKREAEVVHGLGLEPRDGAMEPPVVKVAFFDDEYYLACFNRIKNLDEVCLAKVAESIGLPHSRIR